MSPEKFPAAVSLEKQVRFSLTCFSFPAIYAKPLSTLKNELFATSESLFWSSNEGLAKLSVEMKNALVENGYHNVTVKIGTNTQMKYISGLRQEHAGIQDDIVGNSDNIKQIYLTLNEIEFVNQSNQQFEYIRAVKTKNGMYFRWFPNSRMSYPDLCYHSKEPTTREELVAYEKYLNGIIKWLDDINTDWRNTDIHSQYEYIKGIFFEDLQKFETYSRDYIEIDVISGLADYS